MSRSNSEEKAEKREKTEGVFIRGEWISILTDDDYNHVSDNEQLSVTNSSEEQANEKAATRRKSGPKSRPWTAAGRTGRAKAKLDA